MKKLIFIILSALSLTAHAEFVPEGNSAPSRQHVNTVHEAKTEFGDNAHIVLEGFITGSAGTINPDVWRGQKVTPQTKVRIAGEVDINRFNNSREIEVRRLDVVK